MTKIKAFISLALVLSLLFSIVACVPNSESDNSDDNTGAFAESREVSASIDVSIDESIDESKDDNMAGNIPTNDYKPLNYQYMKAMWLYQYSYTSLFRVNGAQRDESDYRDKVTKICQNLQRDGFNTLFLQVRGHGDSFYPSELFPPTAFVVSAYTDKFVYDPLEIFIEIAHEHQISLHAWINPYRLLTEKQMKIVPTQYKIGEWYQEKEGEYVVKVGNRYYCNPAYPEVQQLVIDGAVEICSKYNVDGLHIDDYFYPDGAEKSFDYLAYTEFGNGRTLKQFRFDSVNSLVKGLYDSVHAVNKELLFGVSPAGNIDANRGYLSADVDTWCSTPGYIDYIAPQAYWSFSHKYDYAKYDICAQKWANLITCDSVKLIMGMGLYRTNSPSQSSSDPDWYLYTDNIKRMLEYTYSYKAASGYIMFSYESLYDIMTGEYVTDNTEERENFLPLVKG